MQHSALCVLLCVVLLSISLASTSLTCTTALNFVTGSVQIGSSLPNYALATGDGEREYYAEISFDYEFEDYPDLFLAVSGLDFGETVPRFDLEVVEVALDGATILVSTWEDTELHIIALTWIATQTDCIDSLGTTQQTRWLAEAGVDSPDWGTYASVWNGSFVYDQTLDSTPVAIGGLAGLDLTDTTRNYVYFKADGVSTTQGAGFSLEVEALKVKGMRVSTLALESSYPDVYGYCVKRVMLSEDSVSDWSLQISSDEADSIELEIPYGDYNFQRVPEVSILVNGFDTLESSVRFKVELIEAGLDSASIRVLSYSDSALNSVDITLFAIETYLPYWTAFDWFLIVAIVLVFINGIVLDLIRSSNVRNGIWKPDLMPEVPSMFDRRADPFRLPSQTGTQPSSGGKKQTSRTVEEAHETLRKQPLSIQLSVWQNELRSWTTYKRESVPARRSGFEKTMMRFLSLTLFLGFIYVCIFFILKYQLLHMMNMWVLTFAILGLEYLLLTVAVLTVDYPACRDLPRHHDNVAILVASHNSASAPPFKEGEACPAMSASELPGVADAKRKGFLYSLKNLTRSVPDGQVYVCHNARDLSPPEARTYECITTMKQWGRNVRYVYVPAGNKTLSLLWTAFTLPEHIKYVVICDDDIIIPPDLSFQTELLDDERVAGAVLTIRAAANKPRGGRTLLVAMQDIEYQLAGFAKLFQFRAAGTAICPHGAISIWKREALINVLQYHDTQFNGEDMRMGLGLREMASETDQLLLLRTFANQPVYTNVPEDILHFREDFLGATAYDEKSLFAQRTRSWDVTAHRFVFVFLKHIFFYWSRHTLLLKLYYLHELLTILQDWLRVFTIFYFFYLDDGLRLLLISWRVLAYQYVILFMWAYLSLKNRPELRPALPHLIIFPFYRIMSLVFRFCALIYNLFVYVPTVRNLPQIRNNPRVVPPYHPIVDSITLDAGNWSRVWHSEDLPSADEVRCLEEQVGIKRFKHDDSPIPHKLKGSVVSNGLIGLGMSPLGESRVALGELSEYVDDAGFPACEPIHDEEPSGSFTVTMSPSDATPSIYTPASPE